MILYSTTDERRLTACGGAGENECFGQPVWILAGMSRQEWKALCAGGFPGHGPPVCGATSIGEVAAADNQVVLLLSPDLAQIFPGAVVGVSIEPARAAIVLVPRRDAPTLSRRDDGPVFSFVCDADVFRGVLACARQRTLSSLCFAVLSRIMNRRSNAARLQVVQLPAPVCPESELPEPSAVILAHRGQAGFLEAALDALTGCRGADRVRPRIGLDMSSKEADAYRRYEQEFPQAAFFRIGDPTPAGPYVVRQALIESAPENLMAFQDSDDISTYDRFTVQYGEMLRTRAQLVGCHELCVDEISGSVHALRFPLNVSEALGAMSPKAECHLGHEPLLHATCMVSRRDFLRVGGFSTDQRIANDTQFMLRAYFSLSMRNVDAFLYVRRVHGSALTVAADTKLGNPLRSSLSARWLADFEAVRMGASLAASSLRPRRSPTHRELRALERAAEAPTQRAYRSNVSTLSDRM